MINQNACGSICRDINVESGTIWIGDPCHLVGRLRDHWDWIGLINDRADQSTGDIGIDEPYGTGLGVWISGFGGDGQYELTMERAQDGRILSLSLRLGTDEDEEDSRLFENAEDGEFPSLNPSTLPASQLRLF